MKEIKQKKKRTLLIGAGEAGELALSFLQIHHADTLQLIGVVDDRKKTLVNFGLPLLGNVKDIEKIVKSQSIEHLIVAIPSLKGSAKIAVLEACAKTGVSTEIMPDLAAIIRGEGTIQAMQKLDYVDLLDREEGKLNYEEMKPSFKQKRVLITGAGGSIGSEIVRQAARCEPQEIILVGHGENSIFTIHHEMSLHSDVKVTPIIADIQDKDRIQEIFAKYTPDIVYHAAAHKHVPMMELNVREAVKNNIIGTKNLVDISERYCIERFIMISTDKSVEPTSVMGATKKMAEWIVQAKNNNKHAGIYSVVRFGNVLGSRGSAIPLFWEQIKTGQPVTITHPDMERYFMTIAEASQLVIEASMLAVGGEVFILKMGNAQKIIDIVRKLGVLAGKKEEQLDIRFIGLRDGEKMSEALFETEELDTADTHFTKYYCGKAQIPQKIYEIEDWHLFFSKKNEEDIRKILLALTNSQPILEKEHA
ncbi:nucleoside-diphosphate sugar epimerase/dehydratase [Listeria sp. PSOL-1]|uniref:polysaccharide biosynthesis protein n=1 Tax=Listeria sp. PSOL-1 TaxID=1844999 RepID=UPI0013D42B59|nr:nucleoside-diphosphate sugar epimerase/dehydratase [Listeria sp. PSOL-1]